MTTLPVIQAYYYDTCLVGIVSLLCLLITLWFPAACLSKTLKTADTVLGDSEHQRNHVP